MRPEHVRRDQWLDYRRVVEDAINTAVEESLWPEKDSRLLAWYCTRIGVNRTLREIACAVEEFRAYPPRDRYRTFRARLVKIIKSTRGSNA